MVHPKPSAQFTVSDDTICSPFTITITDGSSGFDSLYWTFGDGGDTVTVGSLTHTYNNTSLIPVTSTLQLIAKNIDGCTDTFTQAIVVNPNISANFAIVPNDSGCHPFNVTFVNLSQGADTFYWDFGDGSPVETTSAPTHPYINPDTVADSVYSVKLTVISQYSCQADTTQQIVVHPQPVSSFTVSDTVVTAPFIVTLTNSSTGAVSYFWDFGDGDTITKTDTNSFTHPYTNTTDSIVSYTLCLTAKTNFGCTDTSCKPIIVKPQLRADFNIVPNDSGCHRFTVFFINTSVGADTFAWDFGDSSSIDTSKNPTHTFSNTAVVDSVFNVVLIVTSQFGNKDTVTKQVVVHPKPVAQFNMIDTVGCSPLTVTFNNISTGAIIYYWDFGDGDTAIKTNTASFTHKFVDTLLSPILFSITLISESIYGCRDTIKKNITVDPPPNFTFTTLPLTGCKPLQVSFSPKSGAALYEWDFGDTNTLTIAADSTVTHTYNTESTFTVQLIVTTSSGCKDTATQTVTVFPKPAALFSVSDTLNCSPFQVTICNSSTGADVYYWNYGDGNSDTLPDSCFTHPYNNFTDSTVSYIITLIADKIGGCSDTIIKTIYVLPEINPLAGILGGDTAGCHPFTVDFFNQTTGAFNCTWDFGDGDTLNTCSQLINHPFTNDTINIDSVYTVNLYLSTLSCADTVTLNVVVHPVPVAGFTLSDTVGCSPFTLTITNTSSGADNYNWHFGGGSDDTSTTPAPAFTNTYVNPSDTSQLYTITLVAGTQFGCSDTIPKNIVVNPEILAFAQVLGSPTGCHPFTVDFASFAPIADSVLWDFGDATTSTQQNPTHTFLNPPPSTSDSTYIIIFTVYAMGCSVSTPLTVIVQPTPLATFIATPPLQT
ncbi:MAG: PKD domain-containing protein, partial [Cytophagales bacterium]|nr:PKD domain-containing protein [Cytophagales bacterium]